MIMNILCKLAAIIGVIGLAIVIYIATFALLVGVVGLIFWLICLGFDLTFNWWIVLGISAVLLLLRVAYNFITADKNDA